MNAAIPTGRGWYPDPFSKGEQLRLFDGAHWTDQTRPIPADYDPAQAGKPAPERAAPKPKDEGPPRANPTEAPALEPKPKTDAPKSKPAKNGTAPMFSSPTVKAATKTDEPPGKPAEKPSAAQPQPERKKPAPKKAAAPAFSTPTVQAEKPDEDTRPSPEPAAQPARPAPEPAAPKQPEVSFAKPVNGAPSVATPEPAAPSEAAATPAPRQVETPAGPSSPSAVDADPEENSETVTEAFAAAPNEPSFSDVSTLENPTPEKASGAAGKLQASMRGLMGNARLIAWVVTLVAAVAVVAVPLAAPSPLRGVAAECEAISDVVAAFDGAEDFSVTEEAQREIASAISTGKLDGEIADLATKAVEENNLEPVVERCLPQE